METRRRNFLQGLVAAPLAALLDRLVRSQPPVRTYFLNTFSVAGFQYYHGPALIHSIHKGDQLALRAEPDNPYDEFAVRVLWGSRQVGYVPRSDNRHISRLLRQGARLRCEAVRVSPQEVTWQRLKVKVLMIS